MIKKSKKTREFPKRTQSPLGGKAMKSRLSLVLTLSLLILFCAPGIRGEINPLFKYQLNLPSLSTQQAPVVYTAGYGYSSFGIKLFGGLSLGTIRYPDIEGAEEFEQYKNSLMGLAGGIGFETGGQIGAEVDLMYVQKGLKLEGNNIDDGAGGVINGKVNLVINQISIPVLLRFKFMPGTSPYILLGGAVSYILSATAEYDVTFDGATESGSEDLFENDAENLSRLDYSIIGGAGLELAMGTMRIYFEGRYIYGLANILHESQRGTSEGELGAGNDWVKLTTILIMGGIGF